MGVAQTGPGRVLAGAGPLGDSLAEPAGPTMRRRTACSTRRGRPWAFCPERNCIRCTLVQPARRGRELSGRRGIIGGRDALWRTPAANLRARTAHPSALAGNVDSAADAARGRRTLRFMPIRVRSRFARRQCDGPCERGNSNLLFYLSVYYKTFYTPNRSHRSPALVSLSASASGSPPTLNPESRVP